MTKRYPVSMEVEGNTAMWTRPDTGDCPVSYPAPTFSAVKSLFESVLWGKAVEIVPRQVHICQPLVFHTYHTNYGGPLRKAGQIEGGDSFQLLATVLTNVRYQIFADVVACETSDHETEATKQWRIRTKSPGHAYQEIFDRRLKRGQCWHTPFLGWKEFTVSYFGPLREETKPAAINTVLPSMFRKAEFEKKNVRFLYDQNVEINNGVLKFIREGDCHAE
jgi:CRISPR-associated protein Cas5d